MVFCVSKFQKMGEFAVSVEHSEAKCFSFRGLRPLIPPTRGWTPLGAEPPDPRYRLALCALAMPPFAKS